MRVWRQERLKPRQLINRRPDINQRRRNEHRGNWQILLSGDLEALLWRCRCANFCFSKSPSPEKHSHTVWLINYPSEMYFRRRKPVQWIVLSTRFFSVCFRLKSLFQPIFTVICLTMLRRSLRTMFCCHLIEGKTRRRVKQRNKHLRRSINIPSRKALFLMMKNKREHVTCQSSAMRIACLLGDFSSLRDSVVLLIFAVSEGETGSKRLSCKQAQGEKEK